MDIDANFTTFFSAIPESESPGFDFKMIIPVVVTTRPGGRLVNTLVIETFQLVQQFFYADFLAHIELKRPRINPGRQ